MANLSLVKLSKSFGDIQALSDFNLDVTSNEFIVLLGPSGAGKTTTLRLIAGLEMPDVGQVFIDGRDVTKIAPAERDIAFVFQQYSLYPHLTVFENLAFPLRSPMRPTPEAEIKRKVTEVATMLRIDDKLQNAATKLSGGQMQRVAIGRALVRKPALYLMDEPLSSLDAKLRNDLRLELKRVQQDLAATMIYVTHDQTEALTMATRIGVLEGGRLVQLGTPQEVYENPLSVHVAARLGSPRINLLPVSAMGKFAVHPQAVTVGVRAEAINLQPRASNQQLSEGAHIGAFVRRIERLSDEKHVHLTIDCDSLKNSTSVEAVTLCHDLKGIEPGASVDLTFRSAFFFGASGQRITY